MLQVSFAYVNVEGSLEPLVCNIENTFADLYSYVSQTIGNQFQASLSIDQSNVLPNDGTPLSSLYQEGGQAQIFVSLREVLTVSVFLEGLQVSEATIEKNLTIQNFVQQLLLNLNQQSPIQDYQLFDKNGQQLAASPNINLLAPFELYTTGQSQVFLNLTLQKEQIQQQQIVDKDEEQVDSLLTLDAMSLNIDPQGDYVTFKLHKPVLLSGQLKKQQGKPQINNIDLNQLNWTVHKQISYANPDQNGLVVKWDDGTYSAVQFY